MMIAVPRSGWISTKTMGMPARISTRMTSRQVSPSATPRTVRGHGHDQAQHGELGGLELEAAAQAEPSARRPGRANRCPGP